MNTINTTSTLLVIEDNPDNMALVEEILEDEGFNVLQATEAEAGIAQLQTNKVDLILMDISLPRMCGLEATQIIKANTATQHIPIIALTAHAMQHDYENAMAAGCDGFITKPIDEDKLIATIREQLT